MVINSKQAPAYSAWKYILIYLIRTEIHFTKPVSMKPYLSKRTNTPDADTGPGKATAHGRQAQLGKNESASSSSGAQSALGPQQLSLGSPGDARVPGLDRQSSQPQCVGEKKGPGGSREADALQAFPPEGPPATPPAQELLSHRQRDMEGGLGHGQAGTLSPDGTAPRRSCSCFGESRGPLFSIPSSIPEGSPRPHHCHFVHQAVSPHWGSSPLREPCQGFPHSVYPSDDQAEAAGSRVG